MNLAQIEQLKFGDIVENSWNYSKHVKLIYITKNSRSNPVFGFEKKISGITYEENITDCNEYQLICEKNGIFNYQYFAKFDGYYLVKKIGSIFDNEETIII